MPAVAAAELDPLEPRALAALAAGVMVVKTLVAQMEQRIGAAAVVVRELPQAQLAVMADLAS